MEDYKNKTKYTKICFSSNFYHFYYKLFANLKSFGIKNWERSVLSCRSVTEKKKKKKKKKEKKILTRSNVRAKIKYIDITSM